MNEWENTQRISSAMNNQTDTNSELLRVVPSPTHPHLAAINDSNGMNIMRTLNGTPVLPVEQAERIVALLKASYLDPELALEAATENYRQWLEEGVQ